jgi:hypothetical protein
MADEAPLGTRDRDGLGAGGAALLVVPGVAGAATTVGLTAPYEYLGEGNPQPPTTVLAATGLHDLTLAFMLSKKTCDPAWNGTRPLTGGADQAAINGIRAPYAYSSIVARHQG